MKRKSLLQTNPHLKNRASYRKALIRNKVGLDVAIEALKFCRERKRSRVGTLMKYAKIDRVDKIMKPYLEAIL